jgi:hypothetical protein
MTESGRPVLLVRRHEPHRLTMLTGSVMLGCVHLAGSPGPASIAATQPIWAVKAWASGMLLSGLAGLYGALSRNALERALRVEAGAMYLGASALILYSGSLFSYAGSRAWGSGMLLAFWAGANLWRAVQCTRDQRELMKT